MLAFQVIQDIPLYNHVISQLKLCQTFWGDFFHAECLPLTSLRERSSQMGLAKHKRQEKLFHTTQRVSGDLLAEWLEHAPALEQDLKFGKREPAAVSGICHGSLHCLPSEKASVFPSSHHGMVPLGFTAPLMSCRAVSMMWDDRISVFLSLERLRPESCVKNDCSCTGKYWKV